MKKIIMETSIHGKRGPQKVITYGYNTKVAGLNVIRVMGPEKEFCIIQEKTGLSLGVYFTAYTKAIRFANNYLIDFDFNRNAKEISWDYDLRKCIMDAIERKDKQDGISC